MGPERISINGLILNGKELRTLRMALGAFELQLHIDSADSDISTSDAAVHLENLARLHQLFGRLED